VNPCGFPLLPAFLSFYLGADEERGPLPNLLALFRVVLGDQGKEIFTEDGA